MPFPGSVVVASVVEADRFRSARSHGRVGPFISFTGSVVVACVVTGVGSSRLVVGALFDRPFRGANRLLVSRVLMDLEREGVDDRFRSEDWG